METSKSKEGSFGLSYPVLTKSNYTTWAMEMKVFMQACGVWEAVEPKDPKAATEKKTDKRALAIMYQGIRDDVSCQLQRRRRPRMPGSRSKL